jgi:hypothetical protein
MYKLFLGFLFLLSLVVSSCGESGTSPENGTDSSDVSQSSQGASSDALSSGEESSSGAIVGDRLVQDFAVDVDGRAPIYGGYPIVGTVQLASEAESIGNISFSLEDSTGSAVPSSKGEAQWDAWLQVSLNLGTQGLPTNKAVFSDAQDPHYVNASVRMEDDVCIGTYTLIIEVQAGGASLFDTTAFLFEDGFECD